jgi:hypothetical protein
MKDCPFCGKKVDLDDPDTLYPNGIGWKFNEELQCRTYHKFSEVPKEQWCYSLHCSVGCGVEMHGDTREEAIERWNKRK